MQPNTNTPAEITPARVEHGSPQPWMRLPQHSLETIQAEMDRLAAEDLSWLDQEVTAGESRAAGKTRAVMRGVALLSCSCSISGTLLLASGCLSGGVGLLLLAQIACAFYWAYELDL